MNDYISDLKKLKPNLYDELKGIAHGSGLDLEEIFMFNLVEEIMVRLLKILEFPADHSVPSGKCTAAALFGRENLPNMAFQTNDYFKFYEDFVSVIKIKYEDYDMLCLGLPGCIGPYCGMNSKGLMLVANSLINGAVSEAGGLSALTIERSLLECSTVDECVDLLKNAPVSSGVNYIMCDVTKAECIEVTANKAVVMDHPHPHFVAHTNHLIQSGDCNEAVPFFDKSKPVLDENGRSLSLTVERLECVTEMLNEKAATAGVDEAIEALAAVSMADDEFIVTIESIICVCDPDAPHIYVSKGPGKDRKYVKVSF